MFKRIMKATLSYKINTKNLYLASAFLIKINKTKIKRENGAEKSHPLNLIILIRLNSVAHAKKRGKVGSSLTISLTS